MITDETRLNIEIAVWDYLHRELLQDELFCIPANGIIGLAFTTDTDSDGREHDIQMNFELNDMRYRGYIDDQLVLEEQPITSEQFIADMEYCSFDNLISDVLQIFLERFYGTEVV